jgi:hypothetical protein
VRFGKVQLDGVAGLCGQHWALKVGKTWQEVGPELGNDNINVKSKSVGHSSNIVGNYAINRSEGDRAISGAGPNYPGTLSIMSLLWPVVLPAVGGAAVVPLALGGGQWQVLGAVLGLLLVFLLPGTLAAGVWVLGRAVGRRSGLQVREARRCGLVAGGLAMVTGVALGAWLWWLVVPDLVNDRVTEGVTAGMAGLWWVSTLWRAVGPYMPALWRGDNR